MSPPHLTPFSRYPTLKALANICYCLADLNYYHEAMYGTVAAAAAGRLAGCTPRTAARLMWALARARHYSPQLMAAYAAAVRCVPCRCIRSLHCSVFAGESCHP